MQNAIGIFMETNTFNSNGKSKALLKRRKQKQLPFLMKQKTLWAKICLHFQMMNIERVRV